MTTWLMPVMCSSGAAVHLVPSQQYKMTWLSKTEKPLPADAILRVVDAHQTGLIVVGSRGRGELTKSPSRQCEPLRAGPHSRASDDRPRRGRGNRIR